MERAGAPVRLADRLVADLLASVASGEHPPGSRLPPEDVLAGRYRVSRLTLREAVKELRGKGVLRAEQGRGTFVNQVDEWSVLDPALLAVRSTVGSDPGQLATQLTEARRVVEVGAAELAARRRTDADVARLEETLQEMARCHRWGDVEEFSAADMAFHDALNRAAGNPFLAALFQPVTSLLFEVRRHTSVTSRMREVALVAHGEILDAVRDGDADAARAATAGHLGETRRVVDRVLVRNPEERS